MLVQVTSFLNTIIEAPSSVDKRMDHKEDLLMHGVTMAMGDVRIKMRERGYQIKYCSYEEVMKQTMGDEAIGIQNDLPTYDGKTLYLLNEQSGKFKEQSELLINQMDAFDELLRELEHSDGSS